MTNSVKEKWPEILEYLRCEYNISKVSFETWLQNLKCYDVDENIVTIVIKDDALGLNALDFIRDKYGLFIKTAIREITEEDFEIKFVLQSYIDEQEKKQQEKEKKQSGHFSSSDVKYTFDNFVVGDNNNIAYNASLAVAELPGHAYNPLFIYGGVGLGKTHLMHAISNFIMEHDPSLNVIFVSSEKYTNDYITSLRNKNPEEFREKYRKADVLLIDDIQFIIGKENTQEEFFHNFNEMRDSGRQIVISSDKHPREMKILDERIKSRFEWGLTVDIQPPSFETRMAILLNKEKAANIELDEEIISYIAENIKSNIRELEGALTRVIAMSKLKKIDITLELAKDTLKDLVSPNEKKTITPELVVDIVSEHFDLTPSLLASKNKSKNIAYPRQIAMYLAKLLTPASLSDIGQALGGRDHTTVLHGCKKIESDLKADQSLVNTIDILIKKINPL